MNKCFHQTAVLVSRSILATASRSLSLTFAIFATREFLYIFFKKLTRHTMCGHVLMEPPRAKRLTLRLLFTLLASIVRPGPGLITRPRPPHYSTDHCLRRWVHTLRNPYRGWILSAQSSFSLFKRTHFYILFMERCLDDFFHELRDKEPGQSRLLSLALSLSLIYRLYPLVERVTRR